MNRLLIATTNPAKLDEYKILLRNYPLEVVSLRELGINEESPETGDTFAENAMAKAEFYFQRAHIPTLADDGGLEVDALDGAPGVRSHRWLRESGEVSANDADEDRMLAEEVIRRMAGVEPNRRTARLRAAAAIIYGDRGELRKCVVDAALEGIIAERCYREVRRGFPYRAVLFLPERRLYLAELGEEEAASLSQRKALVYKLGAQLDQIARME